MPLPEHPRLSVVFSWNDNLGENEYKTGAAVPQPVTKEGVEQTALNVAGIIAKLLEMEGIIRPQPDTDKGPKGDVL